jgi:peptidoglycan/xylan/chitin deacetylase (PgdA/CDA1 family)
MATLKTNALRGAARALAALSHASGASVLRRRLAGPSLRILAYHRVNDLAADGSPYTVSPLQLDEQIAHVKKHFPVISFSDALRLRERPAEAMDSVIITFDDGYLDNFSNALPILLKHGVKACFFLTTDLISGETLSDSLEANLGPFPGMSWDQVRSLVREGFEVGAHTCSHPNLLQCSRADARREIGESKRELEDRLGIPIRLFAYPYGKRSVHYDDRVRYAVAEKFDACCTTMRSRNSFRSLDSMELGRVCVQRWWSRSHFARELEGALDFVAYASLVLRESFAGVATLGRRSVFGRI